MTAQRPLPTINKGTYKFSVLRIILCGVLMTLLCVACLYVQYTSLDFLHTQLVEQDKKTTAWLLEQLRFSLPFILLSDPELQAIEPYSVWQEKKMCGKTCMGVVRTTFIIDEHGNIEYIMPKVKPDTNAAEILAYLDAKA